MITESALLARANALAGKNLAALAQELDVAIPHSPRQGKGWMGQLVELYLGAAAGSKPGPDFAHLGIELKTLPVNARGKILESTFVCTAHQEDTVFNSWFQSAVYQKLKKVLWVPILATREYAYHDRIIGMPLLAEMTQEQSHILQQDWEEFAEYIRFGQWARIHGRMGVYLQIRPKAAHARARCLVHDAEGQRAATLPRGFYLRTSYTTEILKHAYY
jgi:DNA mismatch repair protein MutH